MAEDAKTELKAVEVTYDAEGNPTVKPIEQPAAEDQNDDNQDDDNQDGVDDNQDDNQDDDSNDDSDDNNDDSSDDSNDDSSDDDSNDDSDEDVDDVDDADDADEDDDDSDVQEDIDEDVVDYDELPEAVQAYLDFYEETGGSMQDFAMVNRDFDSLPQDDVVREFLRKSNPYLDADDIEYEMETRFGISDADSDAEVRAKKVAKKKFYGEAMKSLKADGAKYKADLGSSAALPQQAREALNFQKEFQATQATTAKATAAKVDSFVKNTNKVLGKDFKGFEVKVGEDTLTYKPSNVRKTREENLNVNNLLNRFTDKEGNVTDVKGYHKALTFASNPDAIAAHFFELGKAAQVEEGVKDSKNINMKPRQTQSKQNNNKSKFKFVDVDPTRSKNSKIKLRNY
tara:strand:+ start:5923 stop:7119 length:1197 start_codon:yes stop_codon:yes gene_type:complete